MTCEKSERSLSQTSYINSLALVPKYISFQEFRSIRAKRAWVANKRPGIDRAVSFASEFTETTFDDASHKLLKKVVEHLKSSPRTGLRFPHLDLSTLQLVNYTEAPFNKAPDNKNRLGYIILLMDKFKRCGFT